MTNFSKIALFLHPHLQVDHPVFANIAKAAATLYRNVVVCSPHQQLMPHTPFEREDVGRLIEGDTLAVVLGGDGTFLHATPALHGKNIPILGVNLGTVGFLTDVSPEDIIEAIHKALRGDYTLDSRPYHLARVGEVEFPFVNEVALNRHPHDPPVDVDVTVGGEKFMACFGDGMVIASPTGSTGYNRSAAGPVMHPALQTMALTPLSPQKKAVRPVVVPDDLEIALSLNRAGARGGLLMFDGQEAPVQMQQGDVLHITKSPHCFHIINLSLMSYFEKVHQKLG